MKDEATVTTDPAAIGGDMAGGGHDEGPRGGDRGDRAGGGGGPRGPRGPRREMSDKPE